MSDHIKPAGRGEGDGDAVGVFERFNPGAVPPDHDAPVRSADKHTAQFLTPSPNIEADAGQDPQAPNRKGEG